MVHRTIIDQQVIIATVGTDGYMVEIDINRELGVSDDFSLSVTTVTNTTAPGTPKTITPNLYWSNSQVALASVAAVCAARKRVCTALALTNAASTTQKHEVTVVTPTAEANQRIFRPLGKYLYISFDNTVLGAGATVTLSMSLNRLQARK